nr:uncharacterized protein LOC107451978 [Parasteatoda tepidariorum]
MITENSVAPFAPPDENMYVSCEFCGKDILMDQEAIIVHESGCRPDLLSLPSVVSNEHKLRNSAHEAYSYNDKASALQRKRRSLEKPEDKKESAKEECGICSLIVPKDKLSEHFSKCVVENSNNPYSECGMSTPQPIASCADGSKIKMHTEGAKINLYPSMGELLLCPYCSMNFLSKRFANHKKYCKSALVECPICQDTYHIDEKEEHRTTCDALDTVLIPESDLKLELQNKFGTLHSDENMREKEALYEQCPFCESKIHQHSYSKHLLTCSLSMKQCHLCKQEFPKESERDHFTVCPKLFKISSKSGQDEFFYGGFSPSDSETKIPLLLLTQIDSGARPKNKNSEETSAFYRITGAFKSLFSDFEKANPSHSVDSQTNMYPADANYNVELRNKFGTLHSDENKREKEALYEQCPFCESKIHQHSYSKHLLTCSLSMKQCHLCKQEFPKESERDHFTVCPKLIKISSKSGQDEFFYGGFSKSDSKTKFAIDEDNQEAIEKALLQENEAFTFGSSNKEKNVEEEKLSFKYSPNPFLNNKDSKYHIQNDLTESDNEENESLEEFWERADIKLAQRLRQFTKIKTD